MKNYFSFEPFPSLYAAGLKDGRVFAAAAFAAGAHYGVGQMRETLDDPNVPYIVHPLEVADTVAGVAGISTEAIIAALLHDVVEDTKVPIEVIRHMFGLEVAELVLDVTDVYTPEAYPDKNRAERKRLEAERLSYIDPEAQTIKLADGLSNTPSIAENKPKFMPTYGPEKRAVWNVLVKGDVGLIHRLDLELAKWGY